MALIRRGGKSYWYRSVRKGGKVTSEYVAAGDRALKLAGIVEESRRDLLGLWLDGHAEIEFLEAEGRARDEAEKADRERMEAEERAISGWFDRVEDIARAALEAAGFHRHKRGEWRRRRMAKSKSIAVATTAETPAPGAEPGRRVRDYWNIEQLARGTIVNHLARNDPFVRETMLRDIEDMADELAGRARARWRACSPNARRSAGSP